MSEIVGVFKDKCSCVATLTATFSELGGLCSGSLAASCRCSALLGDVNACCFLSVLSSACARRGGMGSMGEFCKDAIKIRLVQLYLEPIPVSLQGGCASRPSWVDADLGLCNR